MLICVIHYLILFCLYHYYITLTSHSHALTNIIYHLNSPIFSLPITCPHYLFLIPQLNDLRRQQSVIFIVATNRLRSFDAAVTRPGRFDFLLFVGTPNLMSREKRLVSRLEGTRLSAVQR